MIDQKLLTEIQKSVDDAQLGYGAMNHQTYIKHVNTLLRERAGLQEQVNALTKELLEKEADNLVLIDKIRDGDDPGAR